MRVSARVAAGDRGEQPARRAAIAGPAHRGYRRTAESWLLHAGVSAASCCFRQFSMCPPPGYTPRAPLPAVRPGNALPL